MLGGELAHARRNPLAARQRVLGDEIVLVGPRRDLRRVRHRDDLHLLRKPRETQSDRIRHRTARAGVDLVEHERRRRATVRQHDFERKQETRELAARRDLHQRPGTRARIGLHPELDAIDPVRPACVRFDVGGKSGAFELERLQLRGDGLIEFRGGFLARCR